MGTESLRKKKGKEKEQKRVDKGKVGVSCHLYNSPTTTLSGGKNHLRVIGYIKGEKVRGRDAQAVAVSAASAASAPPDSAASNASTASASTSKM